MHVCMYMILYEIPGVAVLVKHNIDTVELYYDNG